MSVFKTPTESLSTDNEYPDFYRASGECTCSICGKIYYKHPYDLKYLDWNDEPYLNKLCNDDLVKL